MNTVGSRLATVRFTTIHFYGLVESDRALLDLCCDIVATQASFLYLVCY